TCSHDKALTRPSGHGISPPRSVATIAMESVSSIAYVPPNSRTEYSSSASMRRAAPVISEASAGKQNSPTLSGCATRQVNGSTSIPWHVTSCADAVVVEDNLVCVVSRPWSHPPCDLGNIGWVSFPAVLVNLVKFVPGAISTNNDSLHGGFTLV